MSDPFEPNIGQGMAPVINTMRNNAIHGINAVNDVTKRLSFGDIYSGNPTIIIGFVVVIIILLLIITYIIVKKPKIPYMGQREPARYENEYPPQGYPPQDYPQGYPPQGEPLPPPPESAREPPKEPPKQPGIAEHLQTSKAELQALAAQIKAPVSTVKKEVTSIAEIPNADEVSTRK